MNRKLSLKIGFVFLLLWCAILAGPVAANEVTGKKALTFQDIMRFKEIHDAVIAEDGLWIAYNAQPDRGDGEVKVHGLKEGKVFTIERGSNPSFSKDSRWVVMALKPEAVELEKAKKEKPKQGMALLETSTGNVIRLEKVERFAFSDDSAWLAYHHYKEEEELKKEEKVSAEEKEKGKTVEEISKKKKESGSTLVLRHLDSGKEVKIACVLSFAFDSSSSYLAYVVADPEGKDNGLYLVELRKEELPRKTIEKKENGSYTNLAWAKKEAKLAFLSGIKEENKAASYSLRFWEEKNQKPVQAVSTDAVPDGWVIPEKNKVTWAEDGKRIFFGLKPKEFLEIEGEKEQKKEEKIDLFAIDKILEKREVDVWHWNDPLIIPNQKKNWPQLKDRTYLAAFHPDSKRCVQLADKEMPQVLPAENPNFALGISDVPYQKELTWYGGLNDIYLVSLKDGSRRKVASRLEYLFVISPGGRYIVYYDDKHWYLFDSKTGATRNLTSPLAVPFYDQDHDSPGRPPGYGFGGWVENDRAVLLYDKFDIWQFSTETGQPLCLTGGKGRAQNLSFRILQLDPEQRFFAENQELLLSAYHDLEKHSGFYSCRIGSTGVEKLIEERKSFRFLAKAKKADALIYTRESYEEFPDIWISNLKFSSPKKISDVNPQLSDFAWGSTELVEWSSLDGIPLQGVLVKPGDYEPGKRYPLIVYFYEHFSQRLYEFNQVVVNHRPCFPFYASNGYAIFLPDIRYDVGRPGFSATKCLVPGVQKLVEMGVVDPKRIGLHGHSWSGYETAFIITQTDIFACAIAGAAVSNMTSAYNGIRWESGMARQFQYEKSQSRIGGSLWDSLQLYIENSPVFFADQIQTPLLLMFGDEDGAVPWYQGIEFYLAMRRLGKDCIFLQYRGEPHHPQKYPNKLDYAVKMKQYFDHYLKGEPAAEWIAKGVPYLGK